MQEQLIAPCGMNCSLCIAYQFRGKDLNKQGFNRTYCPGCIPRGKNCTHMEISVNYLEKESYVFAMSAKLFPAKG